MNKTLSILIVTADRPLQLKLCLNRLSVLPWIEMVEIEVWDNSKDKRNQKLNHQFFKTSKTNFHYHYCEDFIECRNRSAFECKTEYFTILDDDDYLSVDAIIYMLTFIREYPQIKFFSFAVCKEGRLDRFNYGYEFITGEVQKFKLLNDFDNYGNDRSYKVYLWNCAQVISKSLLNDNSKWQYLGCDDILPITAAYLTAETVIKINHPIYYYPCQQTVSSKKSLEDLMKLESNMIKSYAKLRYLFDPSNTSHIIDKAIHNSIRQLEVIDKYNPIHLKELCSY